MAKVDGVSSDTENAEDEQVEPAQEATLAMAEEDVKDGESKKGIDDHLGNRKGSKIGHFFSSRLSIMGRQNCGQ